MDSLFITWQLCPHWVSFRRSPYCRVLLLLLPNIEVHRCEKLCFWNDSGRWCLRLSGSGRRAFTHAHAQSCLEAWWWSDQHNSHTAAHHVAAEGKQDQSELFVYAALCLSPTVAENWPWTWRWRKQNSARLSTGLHLEGLKARLQCFSSIVMRFRTCYGLPMLRRWVCQSLPQKIMVHRAHQGKDLWTTEPIYVSSFLWKVAGSLVQPSLHPSIPQQMTSAL